MWRWLAANPVPVDPAETASLLGHVTTVEEFLEHHHATDR
jgi:hypothetical protein